MHKKTEQKILNLFAFNHKLQFNKIEKAIKERSNKISYHLNQLIKKQVLVKKDNFYILSDNSEYLIPYLSEKPAVLPILLIHLGTKQRAFLYKREKRPYKDKLSLPGGRILLGEHINKAVKRIMKQKHNINIKLKKINSISLEHVNKKTRKSDKSKEKLNKTTIHSFLIIFVTAKISGKNQNPIKLTNINKNQDKIIKSDYELLKKDLDKEINIKTINSLL